MIYLQLLTKEILVLVFIIIVRINLHLILLSEYIHQILLGFPWDNFDILATLLAIIIVVLFDHSYNIKQKLLYDFYEL